MFFSLILNPEVNNKMELFFGLSLKFKLKRRNLLQSNNKSNNFRLCWQTKVKFKRFSNRRWIPPKFLCDISAGARFSVTSDFLHGHIAQIVLVVVCLSMRAQRHVLIIFSILLCQCSSFANILSFIKYGKYFWVKKTNVFMLNCVCVDHFYLD